jgi:hypothetical protein
MATPAELTQWKSMPVTIVNPKVQSSWDTYIELNKSVRGSTEEQWVSLEDVCASRERWDTQRIDSLLAAGVRDGYMDLYKVLTGKCGKHIKSEMSSSSHTLTYEKKRPRPASKHGSRGASRDTSKGVVHSKAVRKRNKKNASALSKDAKKNYRKVSRKDYY